MPGWLVGLVLYLTAAVGLVGRQAVLDPSHVCLCAGPNGDPPFFMWALKWWPYAIGHQINPFYTDLVWYPGGANIATTTGIPAVGLVLAPITSLFGPIASYDVAALLSPVLGALAAYGLCREVTARVGPSLVGGFLFGFSSYELGQLTSHLQVALVFLVPVFPLLILRRRSGVTPRRRFVAALAGVFTGQVLISTEITFDLVLIGAFGLIAWWLVTTPAERPAVVRIGLELVAAGLLAAAVVSPYLYWAAVKGNIASYGAVAGTVFAERYRLDPVNLIVPTGLTWVGGRALSRISVHFDGGNPVEAGAYLGLPVVLLLGWYAIVSWRRRTTRFLLVMLAVTGSLALGPRLSIRSVGTIPLPWRLVENAPAFRAVLPTRFTVFLALLAAVGVAMALAWIRRRPWVAWLVAAAGVVAILPTQEGTSWHSRPPRVPLVLAKAGTYLPAAGSVLMVPVGQYGSSMYWQAASGFDFRLANGRVALVLPPEYGTEKASRFMSNDIGPPPHAWLKEFLLTHRVTAVVVGPDPAVRLDWDTALGQLGLHATQVGEQAVYSICDRPPAGGPCDTRLPQALLDAVMG